MKAALWTCALLIVGSGAGSVLRFLVDRAVARRTARSFPFGTLTVNLTGATLLGLLSGLVLSREAILLVSIAFGGAYTTFSTWMLETQRLAEERQLWPAFANVMVSTVFGLGAALLGHTVAGLL